MDFNVDTGYIFCLDVEITTELHKELAVAIHAMNQTDLKKIKMILSTEGGSEHAALGIYDLLVDNKIPVEIAVNGPCLSAGTLILQAAASRLATPNSVFQFHYGSPDIDSVQQMEFQKVVDDTWMKLIAKRSNLERGAVETIHRADSWMTAKQAMELNLVDSITRRVV